MRYLTLIRKLNVGTENRISKEKLADIFVQTGCRNVLVYINSGNVLFDSDELAEALRSNIGDNLSSYFKNRMRLLVFSKDEYQTIVDGIPQDWQNDQTQRTDVAFYFGQPNGNFTLESLPFDFDFVQVKILANAMAWNLQRTKLNASKLNRLISSDLYNDLTIRNINTVRTISTLLTGP